MGFQIVEVENFPPVVQVNLDGAVFAHGFVSKNGDLSVDVKEFYYDLNGDKGHYVGAVNVPITDNAVSYVSVLSLAVLNVNTTSYPPIALHIRLARVLASGGFITQIIDERPFFTAANSGLLTPNMTPFNKGMSALVTGGDGSLACAVAVAATPPVNGWISVYVNGVSYKVGNGTKLGVPCYFSGDGGITARATGAIVTGDFLYWNGSLAGFQLDTADRIDFVYEAL